MALKKKLINKKHVRFSALTAVLVLSTIMLTTIDGSQSYVFAQNSTSTLNSPPITPASETSDSGDSDNYDSDDESNNPSGSDDNADDSDNSQQNTAASDDGDVEETSSSEEETEDAAASDDGDMYTYYIKKILTCSSRQADGRW